MILIKRLVQGSTDGNSSGQSVTKKSSHLVRTVWWSPDLKCFVGTLNLATIDFVGLSTFAGFQTVFYWPVTRLIRARVGHFENQPIDNIAVVSLSAAKRNRIASAFQWFRMSHCDYESEIMTHNLWRINFGTVTNEDCKKRVGLLLLMEKVF